MNKRMEPPHTSSEKALGREPSLYVEETVVFRCTCELPKVHNESTLQPDLSYSSFPLLPSLKSRILPLHRCLPLPKGKNDGQ